MEEIYDKHNKAEDIIYNKDGTIRYQQEPDKQGIRDWIEAQKRWIQKERKKRYNWNREYKGSHPRDSLSTPDYRAARAQERAKEFEIQINSALDAYQKRVYALSVKLDNCVERQW